jgi:adenylate cyclase
MATIGMAWLSMWPEHPQLSPPRASIMVLPIRNSSGDPGQEYIADAVTDDLTTDLCRLSVTLVIARATAFTYEGKAVDVRQIGREFGIRCILEGSVGRVGTRVQANAQLVDTSSAANIWADRFDTDVASLLDLYDAVTGRIAASLHLQLVRAENRRAIAERATDPDAVDLRLRAMAYLVENDTPENSLFARKFLKASLALDPQNAEAWSQLALVLVRDFLRHWNRATGEDVASAADALQKAFAIDRSIATAHLADGYIRRSKGDEEGALDAFDRALALNPNLALAHSAKAGQLISLGRAKEAVGLLSRAMLISPSGPDIGFLYNYMGRAYFAAGEYDQAITWFQKSVQLQPTVYYNRAWLISAYALKGRLEQHEAQAALSEYREKFKNWGLQNIRDWFAEKEPNPSPGFAATLQELYRGLQIAGL